MGTSQRQAYDISNVPIPKTCYSDCKSADDETQLSGSIMNPDPLFETANDYCGGCLNKTAFLPTAVPVAVGVSTVLVTELVEDGDRETVYSTVLQKTVYGTKLVDNVTPGVGSSTATTSTLSSNVTSQQTIARKTTTSTTATASGNAPPTNGIALSNQGAVSQRDVIHWPQTVGAVLGSVAALAILAIASSYFRYRRRRRRRSEAVTPETEEPELGDKAQLHSECVPYLQPYELHETARPWEAGGSEKFELLAVLPVELYGETSMKPEFAASPVSTEMAGEYRRGR
ncbi:hypothetical protein JX265_011770 [Neoarthrinium moseri]|uniref:Uncharacterized protein n=1 Tax=Neoarthrinium moseri TaxID=1658444 RepID=A0A9P9WC20_9PEZI|nr:uncharacterized protein JN550_002070 [Neoarthrinium moseri]KAI1856258.1 hypothetical protein JX265_011770 [Neoarthrinium moseri]KAI1875784.1 hypothetical protein JN550_002070 [Neoarthrinium moseri]